MKIPETFRPNRNLDNKTEDLIQGAKIFSTNHDECGISFIRGSHNIEGWYVGLKKPETLLFNSLQRQIDAMAVHENNFLYSIGRSVFQENEGITRVTFFDDKIHSLISFKETVYVALKHYIYRIYGGSLIVTARESDLSSLFIFHDKLYDLSVDSVKGKSFIRETLSSKEGLERHYVFSHAASLDDKIYFGDDVGCIHNDSVGIKTPASCITSLAAVSNELFFSGAGLEDKIMAFDPKTRKFRVVVELDYLSSDIRNIVPVSYSFIDSYLV